jgi:hypothetical protein
MGMRIGESAVRLQTYQSNGVVRSTSASSQQATPVMGSPDPQDNTAPKFLGDRKAPDVVQAGFSENSMSPPGAALTALGKGLRQARRVMPTNEQNLEQMLVKAETRRRELRSDQERQAEAMRIPDAASQAKDIVSAVNQAASSAMARLEGKEPQQPQAPSIEVNGQSFSMRRPSGVGANLDVRA